MWLLQTYRRASTNACGTSEPSQFVTGTKFHSIIVTSHFEIIQTFLDISKKNPKAKIAYVYGRGV